MSVMRPQPLHHKVRFAINISGLRQTLYAVRYGFVPLLLHIVYHGEKSFKNLPDAGAR